MGVIVRPELNRIIKPTLGSYRLNPNHLLNRNLAGWWMFNEGAGTVVRSLPYRINSSITNPSWVKTERAEALSFTATSSQTAILTCSNVNQTAGEYNTVSLIVNSATTVNQFPFCFRNADTGACYGLFQETTGLGINSYGNSVYYPTPTANAWVHIVWVAYNGVATELNSELWYNGINQTYLLRQTLVSRTGVNTVQISGYPDEYYWDGKIADLQIFNRRLTAKEIVELYKNPYGTAANPRLLFPSASRFMAPLGIISGSVCWGQSTGVTQDNARTFDTHWTGTGAIENAGDAERAALEEGEYLESEVVYTGTSDNPWYVAQNVYAAGDASTLKYRTGATQAACEAASYENYTVPFTSLGYVQVRIEG